ncbi:MAG: hypothetical protein K0U29_01320 [Gammaproteobacteria bacterium]|nr:hypothetical protein [Gammaproteobacteria bacterium]
MSKLDFKQKSNLWALGPLATLGFFCAELFYLNQCTFPKRIEKMFDYYDVIEPTDSQNHFKHATVTSLFKAITTSTSLYALQSNIFSKAAGDEVGFYMAIGGTTLFFLGNFFAQFSVFLEHFTSKERVGIFSNWPKAFSHYFALGYAVSNAALYFNAFDAAPAHMGLIKNRLTDPETDTEYVALAFGIFMSTCFAYATWRRFQERIYNLISKNNSPASGPLLQDSRIQTDHIAITIDAVPAGDSSNLFHHQDITFWHKFDLSVNSVASVWKTIVTTGSILGFIANNSDVMKHPHQQAILFSCITVTTLLSFLAQHSLYYPSTESIIKEQQKTRASGDSCMVGFFKNAKACVTDHIPCCHQSTSGYTAIA